MNKITIENLSLRYSDDTVPLQGINLVIPDRQISVIFGPAGGGKSSLLRTLNRLNDLADVVHREGTVQIDDQDIYQSGYDVIQLRREVGMVFARPVVLPLSIRENLTYGLQVGGVKDPVFLEKAVETSLKKAALWEEVKDRLDDPAVALSGGQQQRLCLARVLALEPEVILLDEPTSGLDPISTGKVEESLQELKKDYTIILVPHSVQQAARTADQAAFLLQGELIEVANGEVMFTNPQDQRTQDYIQGRFG
jgi:phosphate transport system ATP-binding protein